MKTVNFGIDLGTTNSLISKYENGTLEVFKNPLGLKQTLSSAVAYRKNKIIVGDKARDLLERDAMNVFTCFKRKMGTSESYFVPNLNKKVTPVELSTLVLQELKNFIHTGETVDEIVITIPSSFDTIQSNATKIAGEKAGFNKVYLLQEPIAASLAFANQGKLNIEEKKKWLIYDFGGGTFDVALIEIDDREINVIDNEGDNFLGGLDIDNLIIEKIIVPFLEKEINEENLWQQFKETGNAYQKLYYELLFKAEEAKKELTIFENVEIEIDYPEKDIYETVEISRNQFNALISPLLNRTIAFSKQVLTNNNLYSSDIERIIMVGGTTLIPYVREKVRTETQITVDTNVDPTAAVGIGAAFYAGSKPKTITSSEEKEIIDNKVDQNIVDQFQIFYEKSSNDDEELINVKNVLKASGYYRITRLDGGFDTGIIAFDKDIFCYVDLLKGTVNSFELRIFDENQTEIFSTRDIKISQGKYNVKGQLLPQAICLEIDDIEFGETRLEAIFTKNSILPLKKVIYKTASKTIVKGSDDLLQINIVEGDDNGLPSSGLTIGFIEVSGKDLTEDLIKGTDIEIEIKMSESRDIHVNVFLSLTEQEFKNTFTPTERYISRAKIDKDLYLVIENLDKELQNHGDDYELLAKFKSIRDNLIELQIELTLLSDNDTTDKKFSINNKKRELINQYDLLTRHVILDEEISNYKRIVDDIKYDIETDELPQFTDRLNTIIKDEKKFLNSGNKYLLKSKIKELETLQNVIFNAKDENYVYAFMNYKFNPEVFTNTKKAEKLFKEGDKAMEKQDYKALKFIVINLYNLLPPEMRDKKQQMDNKNKTGLQ
ncbi:Hsp70 family protein [uncultured Tenacibaculum sp.]|uniref:Hsp70 family protein n=1 Tax=uncultured Tenacibaculum sp. TaxID=174713 RepID=UPI00261A7F48|nr:Hsp70 family protein [uncultured Tenacibaculum sp.]